MTPRIDSAMIDPGDDMGRIDRGAHERVSKEGPADRWGLGAAVLVRSKTMVRRITTCDRCGWGRAACRGCRGLRATRSMAVRVAAVGVAVDLEIYRRWRSRSSRCRPRRQSSCASTPIVVAFHRGCRSCRHPNVRWRNLAASATSAAGRRSPQRAARRSGAGAHDLGRAPRKCRVWQVVGVGGVGGEAAIDWRG